LKFRDPDLSDNSINAEHRELGIPPIEEAVSHPSDHPILRMAMWFAIFMLIAATGYTFASAIAFSILVGDGPWPIVAGLVLGGLFAAPFAALLCRKLHARTLLVLVGILISAVSIFNLYKSFLA